ncbi:unnamed protein product [Laminaria digitata]
MIPLAGGAIAHWQFGQGPDIVFIHGWPLHGGTWRRIIPALCEHFTCHVFDMPGVGRSIPWRGPIGLWEHAYSTLHAIDALELQGYALIAHDSGGTIARLLADLDADRVQALVLGNTEIPGRGVPRLDQAQRAAGFPLTEKLVKFAMSSERFRRSRYGFGSCFDDLSQIETDFYDLFVAPLIEDRAQRSGQMRFVRELNWDVVLEDLHDVHARLDAPVLLIWGERDRWFPWKHAKKMVDSFASGPARVETIPAGKLFVHEEFAPQFATWTLEFLLSMCEPTAPDESE